MKLLIDIPEKTYNIIRGMYLLNYRQYEKDTLGDIMTVSIANGTVIEETKEET